MGGRQRKDGFPENPQLPGPLPNLPQPETKGTSPRSHPSGRGADSLLVPKMKPHRLAFWWGVPEPGDQGQGWGGRFGGGLALGHEVKTMKSKSALLFPKVACVTFYLTSSHSALSSSSSNAFEVASHLGNKSPALDRSQDGTENKRKGKRNQFPNRPVMLLRESLTEEEIITILAKTQFE